jgi:hypothetical protein
MPNPEDAPTNTGEISNGTPIFTTAAAEADLGPKFDEVQRPQSETYKGPNGFVARDQKGDVSDGWQILRTEPDGKVVFYKIDPDTHEEIHSQPIGHIVQNHLQKNWAPDSPYSGEQRLPGRITEIKDAQSIGAPALRLFGKRPE